MKYLKPVSNDASDDEKIAFLVAFIAQFQAEIEENKLLEKAGYGGAGLAGITPELSARIPELTQIFPSSVDPSQLWYAVPLLITFSLAMRGLERYDEKRIEEAKKPLEKLKARKASSHQPG